MQTFISLYLCLCCLLIASCREKASEPPLKIGVHKWIGYGTLYLARHQQLFDQRAIKLIEMPSAALVKRALRNESLDVAAMTLEEALALMQFVPDLRIILVMDRSVGADGLLAKPGIQAVAALKNKLVGVENIAVGSILLDAALKSGQLEADDIQLVPVAVNQHEHFYLTDKVDALVTSEPHKSRLIAQGAQSLFDSSALPGQIMDVLVTREAIIQQREAELKALIAAHFKALAHFYRHRLDAMEVIAAYLGARQDDIRLQVEGITIPDLGENRRLLQGELPGLKSTINEWVGMMQERRLLFTKLDTDNILNGRLLSYE
jgi:NitT/TauT family transport system substrate-binding protein